MTEPTTLLSGLAFGESPRWHDGHLLVSDWGAAEVLRVDADGSSTVVAGDLRRWSPDSFPRCVDVLPDGRLLVVAGTTLLRQEPDGELVAHADLSLLGPVTNDIVVDDHGNAYVNGADWQPGAAGPPPGAVALVTPDGAVTQVATDLRWPNGMAITPDGRTLVVAESYGNCLTGYAIQDDGTLADRRVWAETPGDHPDGVCFDAEGAAWYADVGNHRCVRVAEGGEVLQVVEVDRGAFACVLGGPDGRTLHVVTNLWDNGPVEGRGSHVVTVRVEVPGAGHP